MSVLSEEVILAGVSKVADDLSFMLTDRGVDSRILGIFGAMGIHSMSLFSLLGDNRDGIRALLKSPLST